MNEWIESPIPLTSTHLNKLHNSLIFDHIVQSLTCFSVSLDFTCGIELISVILKDYPYISILVGQFSNERSLYVVSHLWLYFICDQKTSHSICYSGQVASGAVHTWLHQKIDYLLHLQSGHNPMCGMSSIVENAIRVQQCMWNYFFTKLLNYFSHPFLT